LNIAFHSWPQVVVVAKDVGASLWMTFGFLATAYDTVSKEFKIELSQTRSTLWPRTPNNPIYQEGNIMAAENYTRYQQSVIRNYYNNKDNVSLQRAQELLTDLYLAEGKKREKVWESLFMHLERIGVPADQLKHLKEAKNPELIAQLIQKKV
jgi:hypothetical protein